MHKQLITTSTNQYNVFVGNGIIENLADYLPKEYQNIMIITDSIVHELYTEDVRKYLPQSAQVSVSVVPAGENSKSIEQYYHLLTEAIKNNLDRKSLIVALGGGVIGDLAGFVAATYMRGIDFVQVPTTILAHDSSVGGKVAINHPEGKNLIGNFYPPQAVIFDTDTLKTLPNIEKRSGYAEVIKHGFISNEAFLEDVLETDITTDIPPMKLNDHLQKGIAVKADIVEKDEKEANIRKFLNFGHTLGHAIESELGYGNITHGEAVAIGMLFAIEVSEATYRISLPYQAYYHWLSANQYPLSLPPLSVQNLINRMKKDKKSENAMVQMVLLKEVGSPVTETISDQDLTNLLDNFLGKLGSE
ncbi:3-dehydroquinate synthase [Gracilibacillus boraciitolerans JCM 21714]|uniref:3-dehydroquinate synthase n=1 Tax=Gracilibacillus boraciitolerans JCM 21714 TaxID=1298598 RepID=W4VDS3_9BACI|nr:3-dehydroquinate synthase [Gracilibacillus boraciitolerans]GAE91367.1 3-dehydroquinate synthase [Gracilibacillus boraciitolerans JCM 21714]